mmetsp:Transcript_1504/g.9245  ORF Transcript_1504/g.9245 Transcript_1504/m.9245 type:complete len:83 (-) Transcript_1504:1635-1883(-)
MQTPQPKEWSAAGLQLSICSLTVHTKCAIMQSTCAEQHASRWTFSAFKVAYTRLLADNMDLAFIQSLHRGEILERNERTHTC